MFVAATDPGWQRQRPNARCRVDGCGYGSARSGMCVLHGQQWQRAGRPDLEEWQPDRPIKRPADGVTCRIEHCVLWPQAASPFCHAHRQTWNANGRPDIDEFAASFSRDVVTEDELIRLDRLGPQLTLEIQYALQCRRDEQTTKTFPTVVMQVVRFLTGTSVTSLLDRSESDWRRQVGRRRRTRPRGRCWSTRDARSRTSPRPAAGRPNTRGTPGSFAVWGSPVTRSWTSPTSPSHGCGIWSNGGFAGVWEPGPDWRPLGGVCAP